MYQIITDETTGSIKITDTYSISATSSYPSPTFSNIDDEYIVTFSSLQSVELFKRFAYNYEGQTENRYLITEYRISRDYTHWTPWMELKPVIDDFPPFTSTDPMYIDIKFIRKGTSNIGVLSLLDFTLEGWLSRNISDGESTIVLSNSNPVVIKPPFIYKVFKITDIEILSNGNILNVDIKYRYSQDYGRTVTNWEPLTKENITTARISPVRFFQIEYLLELKNSTVTKIYDINLIGDFQNVSLDYSKSNVYGIRENCNCIMLGLVGDPGTVDSSGNGTPMLTSTAENTSLPMLTAEQISALYDPYKLATATDLLDKLSNDANAIFGHDVVYFITDPDKKGIDYSFHEYQLYNYVCNELIKISVENNQFPDNQITMNQFDLSLFDSFEVHIPKEVFKKAFGPEKRPSKEDFLWFCQINRMFTIEHAQQFRGFNNNAIYYKVMLKKYSQKSNVIAANPTIAEKVRELTKNSTIDELFGRENVEDKAAVANKEQHRALTHDILRAEIFAKIEKELIENAENIISKTHYALSSVAFGGNNTDTAVIYRNMKDYYKVSDNISYMCWFSINNYATNDTYNFFNYYDDVNNIGVNINLKSDEFKVQLNNSNYSLPLGLTGNADGINEDTWYSYVVNIDQRQRKISQYLYKRDVDDEEDASYLTSTKLLLVYNNVLDMTPVEFKLEDTSARILGSDMKLTNIRMFTDIIPEDQHNKILNQTIIRDDSKYLIFADNANQRLVLPNWPLNQVDKNDMGG